MFVSKKAIGLAVTFCCLSGMGYAQRISMKMQNVTVEHVMDALQKKSGYTFVFSEKDVNTDRVISVNASNQEVKDVVQQMF